MTSLETRDRAAVVDAELRQRARRLETDFYALSELVIEARDGQYFTRFGFLDLASYLEDRLGLSARSILKRLAPAEAVLGLPPALQDEVKDRLAQIGSTKAAILAPALRRDSERALEWLEHASADTVGQLQDRVSRTLGLKPRGPHVPGDRFRRMVVNQVPVERRDQVEAFFEAGKRWIGTDNSVEVFLKAVEECAVEWQHRADKA